jgi:hypothetical protein
LAIETVGDFHKHQKKTYDCRLRLFLDASHFSDTMVPARTIYSQLWHRLKDETETARIARTWHKLCHLHWASKQGGYHMNRNRLSISAAVVAAAWLSAGVGIGLAQTSGSSGSQTINPDPTGPKSGSRSERTGESDVPLPKGSPQAGTVEKGTGSASPGAVRPQAQSGQAVNPSPKESLGGTQSQRERETGVPLPQGSPQAGTVEKGGSTAGMSGSGAMTGQRGSASNIKAVQQALKDKGHDPGPIDGVMGARTKEAIKAFQSASNIEATGTLDARTAQELGVSSASSGSGARGSMKNSGNTGNTTVGKDTDQQNLPTSKKKSENK